MAYLRCSETTHKKLKVLSANRGIQMQKLIDFACESLEERLDSAAPLDMAAPAVLERLDAIERGQKELLDAVNTLVREKSREHVAEAPEHGEPVFAGVPEDIAELVERLDPRTKLIAPAEETRPRKQKKAPRTGTGGSRR